MAGSEKFGTCSLAVKHLIPLLAYNTLNEKKIRFEPLMKPLDKKGKPRGKFVELTSHQLKLCVEESERLVSAIQYKEAAAERKEAKRIRQENEKCEISCDKQ